MIRSAARSETGRARRSDTNTRDPKLPAPESIIANPLLVQRGLIVRHLPRLRREKEDFHAPVTLLENYDTFAARLKAT